MGPRPPVSTPIRRLVDAFAITTSGELLDAATGAPAGLRNVVDACGTRVVCPGGLCPTGRVCAVTSDRSLWCWGRNVFGTVGDGTLEPREAPVLIGTGFVDVDCGSMMTCALKADGTVACWGSIRTSGSIPCDFGEYCLPTPHVIEGLTNVIEIVADIGLYALRADGSVVRADFGPVDTVRTIHR